MRPARGHQRELPATGSERPHRGLRGRGIRSWSSSWARLSRAASVAELVGRADAFLQRISRNLVQGRMKSSTDSARVPRRHGEPGRRTSAVTVDVLSDRRIAGTQIGTCPASRASMTVPARRDRRRGRLAGAHQSVGWGRKLWPSATCDVLLSPAEPRPGVRASSRDLVDPVDDEVERVVVVPDHDKDEGVSRWSTGERRVEVELLVPLDDLTGRERTAQATGHRRRVDAVVDLDEDGGDARSSQATRKRGKPRPRPPR